MMDETTESEIQEAVEAECTSKEAHTIEIPAEIEDSEIHTATSPFETLNAKLDLLLKAQNLTYKEDK